MNYMAPLSLGIAPHPEEAKTRRAWNSNITVLAANKIIILYNSYPTDPLRTALFADAMPMTN